MKPESIFQRRIRRLVEQEVNGRLTNLNQYVGSSRESTSWDIAPMSLYLEAYNPPTIWNVRVTGFQWNHVVWNINSPITPTAFSNVWLDPPLGASPTGVTVTADGFTLVGCQMTTDAAGAVLGTPFGISFWSVTNPLTEPIRNIENQLPDGTPNTLTAAIGIVVTTEFASGNPRFRIIPIRVGGLWTYSVSDI
jgi:hypothetical protein